MSIDEKDVVEIKIILRALAMIRSATGYGSVNIVLKDGKVTLLETTVKTLIANGETGALKKIIDDV